jgi:quinol monooxygenase YgiN
MIIARYAKVTANTGSADEVERVLLGAAASLESNACCLLYLVSRQRDDNNVVWVTELWSDQHALDAARSAANTDQSARDFMETVQSWEMIELDLAGGKGPLQ